MMSREAVLAAVKGGRKHGAFDGRDYGRLVVFFPVEEWEAFGCSLREGDKPPAPKDWTREVILEQLKSDLAFAFEKALDRRGLSAGCMFEVIRMWMWVLEDDLQNYGDAQYAQYGLPLLKAVAVKYGLDNPIGDDSGSEFKYSSEGRDGAPEPAADAPLSPEAYTVAVQQIALIANMIRGIPVDKILDQISLTESSAPLFNPTAYMVGRHQLELTAKLVRAAQAFQRALPTREECEEAERKTEAEKRAAGRGVGF